MSTVTPNRLELDEQLSAHFDGELDGAPGFDETIARDPELAASLADFEFMRAMVVGTLEQQAERVPEARFEQIWDAFEATLERESRLQTAAEAPPGLWQRLLTWAGPLRVPIATAAAAAVLAVVVVKSVGSPDDTDIAKNTPEQPSSEQPHEVAPVRPNPPGPIAVAPDPLPDADPNLEALSQPEPGEAEIKRIEFGGRTGTISQVEGTRGTTTVIWVTEDEEPVDTERSL